MDFPSHLRIGGLLYSWIKQTYMIKLHKAAFLYGCIKPDYEHLFCAAKDLKDHHTYKHCFELVLKMYEDMPPVGGPQFSLELGRICHYLMDFCTFPHCEASDFSLLQHILYEKQMGIESIFYTHRLFHAMIIKLPLHTVTTIPSMIEYIHKEYLAKSQQLTSLQEQMACDIAFACINCTSVTSAYFAECHVPAAPEPVALRELPAAMYSIL